MSTDEIKPEIKTGEQLEKERLERYQKNPGNFVEMSDIVLCAIRNENSGLGLSVYVGNCKRSEIGLALTELTHTTYKRLIRMDVESEIKHPGSIIPARGGMLNFARKK